MPKEVEIKKNGGTPTLTVQFGNDILRYEFLLYLFPDDDLFERIADITLDASSEGESQHTFPIKFKNLDKDELEWQFRVIPHPTAEDNRWVKMKITQGEDVVFKKNYKGNNLKKLHIHKGSCFFKEV